MVLGLKILSVLFISSILGLAIVVLPSHPITAPVYGCFVETKECLDGNPVETMTSKMMPTMSYYGP